MQVGRRLAVKSAGCEVCSVTCTSEFYPRAGEVRILQYFLDGQRLEYVDLEFPALGILEVGL